MSLNLTQFSRKWKRLLGFSPRAQSFTMVGWQVLVASSLLTVLFSTGVYTNSTTVDNLLTTPSGSPDLVDSQSSFIPDSFQTHTNVTQAVSLSDTTSKLTPGEVIDSFWPWSLEPLEATTVQSSTLEPTTILPTTIQQTTIPPSYTNEFLWTLFNMFDPLATSDAPVTNRQINKDTQITDALVEQSTPNIDTLTTNEAPITWSTPNAITDFSFTEVTPNEDTQSTKSPVSVTDVTQNKDIQSTSLFSFTDVPPNEDTHSESPVSVTEVPPNKDTQNTSPVSVTDVTPNEDFQSTSEVTEGTSNSDIQIVSTPPTTQIAPNENIQTTDDAPLKKNTPNEDTQTTSDAPVRKSTPNEDIFAPPTPPLRLTNSDISQWISTTPTESSSPLPSTTPDFYTDHYIFSLFNDVLLNSTQATFFRDIFPSSALPTPLLSDTVDSISPTFLDDEHHLRSVESILTSTSSIFQDTNSYSDIELSSSHASESHSVINTIENGNTDTSTQDNVPNTSVDLTDISTSQPVSEFTTRMPLNYSSSPGSSADIDVINTSTPPTYTQEEILNRYISSLLFPSTYVSLQGDQFTSTQPLATFSHSMSESTSLESQSFSHSTHSTVEDNISLRHSQSSLTEHDVNSNQPTVSTDTIHLFTSPQPTNVDETHLITSKHLSISETEPFINSGEHQTFLEKYTSSNLEDALTLQTSTFSKGEQFPTTTKTAVSSHPENFFPFPIPTFSETEGLYTSQAASTYPDRFFRFPFPTFTGGEQWFTAPPSTSSDFEDLSTTTWSSLSDSQPASTWFPENTLRQSDPTETMSDTILLHPSTTLTETTDVFIQLSTGLYLSSSTSPLPEDLLTTSSTWLGNVPGINQSINISQEMTFRLQNMESVTSSSMGEHLLTSETFFTNSKQTSSDTSSKLYESMSDRLSHLTALTTSNLFDYPTELTMSTDLTENFPSEYSDSFPSVMHTSPVKMSPMVSFVNTTPSSELVTGDRSLVITETLPTLVTQTLSGGVNSSNLPLLTTSNDFSFTFPETASLTLMESEEFTPDIPADSASVSKDFVIFSTEVVDGVSSKYNVSVNQELLSTESLTVEETKAGFISFSTLDRYDSSSEVIPDTGVLVNVSDVGSSLIIEKTVVQDVTPATTELSEFTSQTETFLYLTEISDDSSYTTIMPTPAIKMSPMLDMETSMTPMLSSFSPASFIGNLSSSFTSVIMHSDNGTEEMSMQLQINSRFTLTFPNSSSTISSQGSNAIFSTTLDLTESILLLPTETVPVQQESTFVLDDSVYFTELYNVSSDFVDSFQSTLGLDTSEITPTWLLQQLSTFSVLPSSHNVNVHTSSDIEDSFWPSFSTQDIAESTAFIFKPTLSFSESNLTTSFTSLKSSTSSVQIDTTIIQSTETFPTVINTISSLSSVLNDSAEIRSSVTLYPSNDYSSTTVAFPIQSTPMYGTLSTLLSAEDSSVYYKNYFSVSINPSFPESSELDSTSEFSQHTWLLSSFQASPDSSQLESTTVFIPLVSESSELLETDILSQHITTDIPQSESSFPLFPESSDLLETTPLSQQSSSFDVSSEIPQSESSVPLFPESSDLLETTPLSQHSSSFDVSSEIPQLESSHSIPLFPESSSEFTQHTWIISSSQASEVDSSLPIPSFSDISEILPTSEFTQQTWILSSFQVPTSTEDPQPESSVLPTSYVTTTSISSVRSTIEEYSSSHTFILPTTLDVSSISLDTPFFNESETVFPSLEPSPVLSTTVLPSTIDMSSSEIVSPSLDPSPVLSTTVLPSTIDMSSSETVSPSLDPSPVLSTTVLPSTIDMSSVFSSVEIISSDSVTQSSIDITVSPSVEESTTFVIPSIASSESVESTVEEYSPVISSVSTATEIVTVTEYTTVSYTPDMETTKTLSSFETSAYIESSLQPTSTTTQSEDVVSESSSFDTSAYIEPSLQLTSTITQSEDIVSESSLYPESSSSFLPLSSSIEPTTSSSEAVMSSIVNDSVTPSESATVTPPTGEPTLNTSDVFNSAWVITVIKVSKTEDVSTKEFEDKMEYKLGTSYNKAFIRAEEIKNGTYVPLRRRRRRYAETGDVQLEMIDVSRSNTNVDLVYYMKKSGEIIPADQAVTALALLSDQELALQLGYVVETNAKPYTPTVAPTEESPKYWIIGAVLGSVAGAIIIIWCTLCMYFRCCRTLPPKDLEEEGAPHLVGLKDKDFEATHPEANYIHEMLEKARSNGTAHPPQTQISEDNSEDPLYAQIRKPKKRPKPQKSQRQSRSYGEEEDGSVIQDTTQYVSDEGSPKTQAKPPKRRPRTKRKAPGEKGGDSMEYGEEPPSEQSTRTSIHYMKLPAVEQTQRSSQNGRLPHTEQNDPDLQQKLHLERLKNKQRQRDRRRNSSRDREKPSGTKVSPREITHQRPVVSSLPRDETPQVQGFVNGAFSESEPEADRHPQETLDQARHRMHRLLDDAFSLVTPVVQANHQNNKLSPSMMNGVSTEERRARPKPIGRPKPQPAQRRPSSQTELEELKTELIKNHSMAVPKPTPRKSTVEKKHTPLIIDPGNRVKEVNKYTWNPYSAGDQTAELALPQEEEIKPMKAGSSPFLGRFQTTTFKENTPVSYTGNLGSMETQYQVSGLTVQEPKPIIITTRKDAWSNGHYTDSPISEKYEFIPKDTSTLTATSKSSSSKNNSRYAALIRDLESDSIERKYLPGSLRESPRTEGDIELTSLEYRRRKAAGRRPDGSDELDVIKDSLASGVSPEPLIRSIREELMRLSSGAANKESFSSC